MPLVDFTFSGWVSGASIDKVSVIDKEKGLVDKDVSSESAESVVEKLESGDYIIALGDYLYNCKDSEIVMEDFEERDQMPGISMIPTLPQDES